MTDQASQPEFPYLPRVTINATLQQIADALPRDPAAPREALAAAMKVVTAALFGLRPRDPIELALAARIVIVQAVMADCMRRANQPGLPEALRYRNINQSIALCRLEDTTYARLTDRQRHAVVPPAGWQVTLPEPRPQAPYVAPEGRAAHRAPMPVAAAPLRQADAPDEQVAPVAPVAPPAPVAARPVMESRHERRRRERAERRLAAAARTVGAAIGARGDGEKQPVQAELAARTATSAMALAA